MARRFRVGVAVFNPAEAEKAATELGGPLWVVKSQIHAGGRGKGKFKEAAAARRAASALPSPWRR